MKRTPAALLLLWMVAFSPLSEGKSKPSLGTEIGPEGKTEHLGAVDVIPLLSRSVRDAKGNNQDKESLGKLDKPRRKIKNEGKTKINPKKSTDPEIKERSGVKDGPGRLKDKREKERNRGRQNRPVDQKNQSGKPARGPAGSKLDRQNKEETKKTRPEKENQEDSPKKTENKKNERKKISSKKEKKIREDSPKRTGNKKNEGKDITSKKEKKNREDSPKRTGNKKNEGKDITSKKEKKIRKKEGKQIGDRRKKKLREDSKPKKKSGPKKLDDEKIKKKNHEDGERKEETGSKKSNDKKVRKGKEEKGKKKNKDREEAEEEKKTNKGKRKNTGRGSNEDSDKGRKSNSEDKNGEKPKPKSKQRPKSLKKPSKTPDINKSLGLKSPKPRTGQRPQKLSKSNKIPKTKTGPATKSSLMSSFNRLRNICDATTTLGYSEGIVTYSDNNRAKVKCTAVIKTPPGTSVGFNCISLQLNMRGCRRERLKLKAPNKKKNFCKNRKPNGIVFPSNEVTVQYRRKKLKRKECSGGFICEIYTVGDPPVDDLIDEYIAKQLLRNLMETLNNLVNASTNLLQQVLTFLKNRTTKRSVTRQAESSGSAEASLNRLVSLLGVSTIAITNEDNNTIASIINEMPSLIDDVETLPAQVFANPSNFDVTSLINIVEDGIKAGNEWGSVFTSSYEKVTTELEDLGSQISSTGVTVPSPLPPASTVPPIVVTIPTTPSIVTTPAPDPPTIPPTSVTTTPAVPPIATTTPAVTPIPATTTPAVPPIATTTPAVTPIPATTTPAVSSIPATTTPDPTTLKPTTIAMPPTTVMPTTTPPNPTTTVKPTTTPPNPTTTVKPTTPPSNPTTTTPPKPTTTTVMPTTTPPNPTTTVMPTTTPPNPTTTVMPTTTTVMPTTTTVMPTTTTTMPTTTTTMPTTTTTMPTTTTTMPTTTTTMPTTTTTMPTTTTTMPTTTSAESSTTATSCSVTRAYCPDCGVAQVTADGIRIVNGTAAAANEYPYQVIIFPTINGTNYQCGGSIIKKRWILTAAHCFFDDELNKAAQNGTLVGYGSSNRWKGTFVYATRYILHENYTAGLKDFDIALIELPSDLNYESDATIQPICLAEESDIVDGGKAVATGWGALQFNGTSPDDLQEVVIDIISTTQCRRQIELPTDTSSVVCALTAYKDTCQGDSGGPLVVRLCPNRWAQIGIVSYGVNCSIPEYPGVYTRVPSYRTWIDTNTGSSTTC